MTIPFTQYLRPDGRKRPMEVDRPSAVEAVAWNIIALGGRFEIEVLTTGEISMTVAFEEEDIAIEVCENGPPIMKAVDRLVFDAAKHLRGEMGETDDR